MSEKTTLGYLNPVSGEHVAFPDEINTLDDVREYLGAASSEEKGMVGWRVGGPDTLTFRDLLHDPATHMLASAREQASNDVRGFIRMPAPQLDIYILDGEWKKHGSVEYEWTFATATMAEYRHVFQTVLIPDQVLADPAHYLDKAITFPARKADGSLLPVILERIPERGHEHEHGAFACKDPCMALAICQQWGMFDGSKFTTEPTSDMADGRTWTDVLEEQCVALEDWSVGRRYVFADGSVILSEERLAGGKIWGVGIHYECEKTLNPIERLRLHDGLSNSGFAAGWSLDMLDLRYRFLDAGSPETAPEPRSRIRGPLPEECGADEAAGNQ